MWLLDSLMANKRNSLTNNNDSWLEDIITPMIGEAYLEYVDRLNTYGFKITEIDKMWLDNYNKRRPRDTIHHTNREVVKTYDPKNKYGVRFVTPGLK